MVERGGGQLVFVASFAGKVPSAGESSIYTATKFGLRGFAHVLRAQMKRKEVGVSLVTPGPVRDVGMFARGGEKTPPLIGTSSPETSARPSCARSSATPRRSTLRRSGCVRCRSSARRTGDDRRPHGVGGGILSSPLTALIVRNTRDSAQDAARTCSSTEPHEVLRRYREPRDSARVRSPRWNMRAPAGTPFPPPVR